MRIRAGAACRHVPAVKEPSDGSSGAPGVHAASNNMQPIAGLAHGTIERRLITVPDATGGFWRCLTWLATEPRGRGQSSRGADRSKLGWVMVGSSGRLGESLPAFQRWLGGELA